ncbi:MAG: aminotransferase class IV, partial [Candidatus Micrarchaeia archaeon]
MTMKTVPYIWMNGRFVKWKDAKVHILTHALHYGTGVFEGIRCYDTALGPAVFRLKDHMERLENSAKALDIEMPYSIVEMCNATKSLIRKNRIKECYIRPIIYYGYGKMGLDPRGASVDAAIAVWPWGKYLGEESVIRGVRCRI